MSNVLNFEAMPERKESCDKHGEFMSRKIFGRIWTKCPVCTAEEEEQRKVDAEEKEREQKRIRWERALGTAGIPERFRDRSLKTYIAESDEQKRALAFADSYANDFDQVLKTGRGAIFCGLPGTGKTHLAVGIGLRIMNRDGRSVLFTTVMRAIRRVKDTWRRDSSETETEAIAALAFPDLLILDEVGVQFGSEAEKLILFDVLNERYERRKPTILLSNLKIDEVKAYLGERVFDRMREDGGEFIPFAWESYRGRVA